jgi:hypothetical protein
VPDGPASFKHFTDSNFWFCYERLPTEIQSLALKNYKLLKADPRHPSLQFKKVGEAWSVRVGSSYRALAVPIPEGYLWFWIGPHHEYDRLIRA